MSSSSPLPLYATSAVWSLYIPYQSVSMAAALIMEHLWLIHLPGLPWVAAGLLSILMGISIPLCHHSFSCHSMRAFTSWCSHDLASALLHGLSRWADWKSSLLTLLPRDADLCCACKHHCVGLGKCSLQSLTCHISRTSVRVLAPSVTHPHTFVPPPRPTAPRRCWTLYLYFALCSSFSFGRLSSYLAPLLATQYRWGGFFSSLTLMAFLFLHRLTSGYDSVCSL